MQCQRSLTKISNDSRICLTLAKKAPKPVRTSEKHNFRSGTTAFMIYDIRTVVSIEHLRNVKNLFRLTIKWHLYNGMLTSLTLYNPKSTVTKFDTPILNPMLAFSLTSLNVEIFMPIVSRNPNDFG